MIASGPLVLPYVLAAGAALLLRGHPVRFGVAGIVFVAMATAAAARVTVGTPSFHAINTVMLCAGMLLFVVAVVLMLKGPAATISATSYPHAPAVRVHGEAALRRWGMLALLGLLLLPALWFVMTVAGPDARSIQGLRDAPFSSAGETLLAALLLPASLVLAGVWPFSLITRGPRLSLLAALLLCAAVVPMVPEGLEHWRSLYAGWLVVAAFIAAAGADWPRLMACAGLFAIGCGGEPACLTGLGLTGVASFLSIRPATSGWRLRLAYVAAGACGIAALRVTLANEVVYSVLLLVPVVLGTLRAPRASVEPAQ